MLMLNPDLFLDEKFFSEPKQEALRVGFGRALLGLGKSNPKVVAACADLTGSTKMDSFRDAFPERFFEVGITEQHMAAFASGLAAMGKIPFISSYAMFSPGRNWEQIRTTVCYNDMPVKIVGSHAGISVGPDGGTHQAIEDIALMRVLPRMVVLAPMDSFEAERATKAAADIDAPVYIRLARENTPLISTNKTPFEIGKIYEIWRSDEPKLSIFATGTSVYQALRAAKALDEQGLGVILLSVPTIKPLDKEAVLMYAHETGAALTVENHQVAGGLGSVIAETLVEERPVPMKMLGVKDKFGQSGSPDELLEYYELDAPAVEKAAKELLDRIKVYEV